VSVTNNGYGGNSFAPAQGGNPQNGNATITTSGTGPTAKLTIKFMGTQSSGDNLSFTNANAAECTNNLGLQTCNVSIPGEWLWNIEGTAIVSDNDSNWTVTQNLVSGRLAGNTKNSNGTLVPFDTALTPDTDTLTSGINLQQTAGQTSIYWIDGPGQFEVVSSNPVDSVKMVQNFTTQFCSTVQSDDCYTISWYVKIVVDPGANLDRLQSWAALGSTNANF
jgi:hypothetical protein